MAENTVPPHNKPVAIPIASVPRVKAANYQRVYANNVFTRMTIWDFRLDFAALVEGDIGQITLEEQVAIYMSPQHTKALRDLLVRNVEAYETKYGPIPTDSEDADEDSGEDIVVEP